MFRRYWAWACKRQRPYSAGFRPPVDVLLSLVTLCACLTGTAGLLIGLAVGEGSQGLATGIAVAFPLALMLSAAAKHQAHRAEADRGHR
jgi:hypothetical protein